MVFSNASLEQAADELCGDDLFCRFDIATTENTMVGLSTLNGGQEFKDIVNISRPSKSCTFFNSIPNCNTCMYETTCNINSGEPYVNPEKIYSVHSVQ